MPDILGNNPEDYKLVQDLQETNQWDRYEQSNAMRRPGSNSKHDFQALGSGVPKAYQRATAEDAQAIGFLTNNLLALQTAVDNVLYTRYRLPMWLFINTAIPEGASSYGITVRNRVGRAKRISSAGDDAPSATVSGDIVTQQLHWYGLDAEWTIDELRGAMFAGQPLDAEAIDAAVTGTLETMEAVGLTGGGYAERGLLNLPYNLTGDDADDNVVRTVQASGDTFTGMDAEEIRTLITGRLSAMIEDSRETIGGDLTTGCTIYLPGNQYDQLTSRYIGDNADHTIMETLMRDNPWTHFTKGQPISIERVLELKDIGRNAADDAAADRMVVTLRHQRIAEMGVSIMPRIMRIEEKGRGVCAMVEAKFSPVFVKRPKQIYYVDGV